MTKSLEETFNLPPLKTALKDEQDEAVEHHSIAEELEDISPDDNEPTKVLKALSVAEKIDHALTKVDELDESDNEMDHIAAEALEAYAELKDLAMNMSDAHSGRMMEVAAQMLRTSLGQQTHQKASNSTATNSSNICTLTLKNNPSLFRLGDKYYEMD
jgi:hypothetical protein